MDGRWTRLLVWQCTPHFLFGLAEKKTGRARSKRKERQRRTCTCVQVCLNTGVVLNMCRQNLGSLLPARAGLGHSLRSVPACRGLVKTSGWLSKGLFF